MKSNYYYDKLRRFMKDCFKDDYLMRKIFKNLVAVMMVAMLALALFGCGGKAAETDADAGPATVAFDVVINGEVTQTHVGETEADNLGDFLRESGAVEGEDTEYGMFITTVDGVKADDSQGQWWCVTKGGQTVQTGVDSTPIADGDKFELTLMYEY